jgi:hypothetical protein
LHEQTNTIMRKKNKYQNEKKTSNTDNLFDNENYNKKLALQRNILNKLINSENNINVVESEQESPDSNKSLTKK